MGDSFRTGGDARLSINHPRWSDGRPRPSGKPPSRRKYLEENAAAVEIKLTPDEVAELEGAVPQSEIVGYRYTPANMKAIDR